VLTYSWLSEPPAIAGWFVIDPATGAVSIGAGANLNFNTASSYNMTVLVTYAAIRMTDTAAVTIWIREVGMRRANRGVATCM
jgi:hypothetical protein